MHPPSPNRGDTSIRKKDQDFTHSSNTMNDHGANNDEQNTQKEQSNSITSLETSPKICHGNQDDFHEMMM
jgi:hypothetical protein